MVTAGNEVSAEVRPLEEAFRGAGGSRDKVAAMLPHPLLKVRDSRASQGGPDARIPVQVMGSQSSQCPPMPPIASQCPCNRPTGGIKQVKKNAKTAAERGGNIIVKLQVGQPPGPAQCCQPPKGPVLQEQACSDQLAGRDCGEALTPCHVAAHSVSMQTHENDVDPNQWLVVYDPLAPSVAGEQRHGGGGGGGGSGGSGGHSSGCPW